MHYPTPQQSKIKVTFPPKKRIKLTLGESKRAHGELKLVWLVWWNMSIHFSKCISEINGATMRLSTVSL
jgi:uncharacterized metal-binding protein